MMHMLGWTQAQTAVALSEMTVVNDGIFSITNGGFLSQQDIDIVAVFASQIRITRARLVTPSFRHVTLPEISPISGALLPPNDPNVADYRANPLRWKALETLTIEDTTTGAAGDAAALAVIRDSFQPMPGGQIYTLVGFATGTLVADAWTDVGTIVWADNLPTGTYAIVGLSVFGATVIGSRLILNNTNWRPGTVGQLNTTLRTHQMFRKGGLGVWGTFKNTAMPQVESLANAADTATTVMMDIIPISGF